MMRYMIIPITSSLYYGLIELTPEFRAFVKSLRNNLFGTATERIAIKIAVRVYDSPAVERGEPFIVWDENISDHEVRLDRTLMIYHVRADSLQLEVLIHDIIYTGTLMKKQDILDQWVCYKVMGTTTIYYETTHYIHATSAKEAIHFIEKDNLAPSEKDILDIDVGPMTAQAT